MSRKQASENEKADTIAEMEADQKYLTQMTLLCKSKDEDFQSRQKLRSEELEALKKCIEIISDEKVKGAGVKHLPAFFQAGQQHGFVSLAQLRHDGDLAPLQQRIAQFL